MNPVLQTLLISGTIAAFGLAGWLWIAIGTATEDLRNLRGFEGMHFED
jgi:hypothetical protein